MKSLYATTLVLKPEAMRRLRVQDAYSLHRIVYDLFSPSFFAEGVESQEEDGRILWVDDGERVEGRRLRILSVRAPTSGLDDDVRLETHQVPESFFMHDNYAFRLVANVSVSQGDRRLPLKDPVRIEEWMRRRAKACGFEVESLGIDRIRGLSFRKGSHLVTLSTARFFGHLVVTNRVRFIEAVKRGVGHGRAWGLGMLQLSIPSRFF